MASSLRRSTKNCSFLVHRDEHRRADDGFNSTRAGREFARRVPGDHGGGIKDGVSLVGANPRDRFTRTAQLLTSLASPRRSSPEPGLRAAIPAMRPPRSRVTV
jgi:hypothetical protein